MHTLPRLALLTVLSVACAPMPMYAPIQAGEEWSPPAFRADHVGLFAEQGEEITFPVFIEEGTTILYVASRGGTGDADLRVHTAVGDLLCESMNQGNEETCAVWDPPVGELLVTLAAHVRFSDVQLDFEINAEDPGSVPVPEPILIAQPDSDERDLEVEFQSTNRHGVLSWTVIPHDPDGDHHYAIDLSADYDRCHREDQQGEQRCVQPHPVLGNWTAAAYGVHGARAELTWQPLPLLVDETHWLDESHPVLTTEIQLPDGTRNALVALTAEEGLAAGLTVRREGFVLCEQDAHTEAACSLPGASPGAYEVEIRGTTSGLTLQVSASEI